MTEPVQGLHENPTSRIPSRPTYGTPVPYADDGETGIATVNRRALVGMFFGNFSLRVQELWTIYDRVVNQNPREAMAALMHLLAEDRQLVSALRMFGLVIPTTRQIHETIGRDPLAEIRRLKALAEGRKDSHRVRNRERRNPNSQKSSIGLAAKNPAPAPSPAPNPAPSPAPNHVPKKHSHEGQKRPVGRPRLDCSICTPRSDSASNVERSG